MGLWEWVNSAADSVKRNTPDVTPVTEACRKGYEVGRATTVQVDGAVRATAREVHEYLSDDQVQDNLSRIARNISKNGALFVARSYGAGPIIDVVSRSVQDGKTDSQKARIDALETKLAALEKEFSSRVIIVGQAGIPRASVSIASKVQDERDIDANMNQTPEDVLRVFMMKQFVGTRLFDDLIVPGAGRRMKEKLVS